MLGSDKDNPTQPNMKRYYIFSNMTSIGNPDGYAEPSQAIADAMTLSAKGYEAVYVCFTQPDGEMKHYHSVA
jgi:hypothetical protein